MDRSKQVDSAEGSGGVNIGSGDTVEGGRGGEGRFVKVGRKSHCGDDEAEDGEAVQGEGP